MLIVWFLSIKSLPNLLFCVLCLPGDQSHRFAQPTINPLACCICWAGLLGRAVFPPWNEGPNFGSYRTWTYLLPWTQQIYSYMWTDSLKRTWELAPQWRIKRTTWRWVGEAENYLTKNLTHSKVKPYPHNGERSQLTDISLRGMNCWHLSLWDLYKKVKLSKHLTWKTNEGNA